MSFDLFVAPAGIALVLMFIVKLTIGRAVLTLVVPVLVTIVC